jgi:hypothetical protein
MQEQNFALAPRYFKEQFVRARMCVYLYVHDKDS